MSDSALRKIPSAPLDPKGEATLRQREAGNPMLPVWVEASAGSGKTKVLVDRMLRLMLPAPGRHACRPSAILCITFTKAAAAEVMDRVTRRLREWTVTDDASLLKSLNDLLGTAPDADQIKQARSLFAQVLDAPGGMKIMTIHAFCQSVLARFPLEAGLPAGFDMMDDVQAKTLMREVRRNLIAQLMADDRDTPLKASFQFLSALQTIDDIEFLMEKLSGERSRLQNMVHDWGGIDGLCHAVDTHLKISHDVTEDDLIAQFFETLPRQDLQALCNGLSADKGKTNQKFAAIIQAALDGPVALDQYSAAFLKKTDGQPYQPTGTLKTDPVLLGIWTTEGSRLQELMQIRKSILTATCTKSLLRFGVAALNGYETEKRRRNLSDFEDLIALTKKLLSGSGVHWVQYKLDNGIDHILVDEAQDTNPDQWDIITSLYDEFYSGLSTREDMVRTTFVVGDEKQSIYSFQRADPRIFAHQRKRLHDKTQLQDNVQQVVSLNASFRSGASILQFVDTVFAPESMVSGVVQSRDPVLHVAADSGKAGHVEIWPLFKNENRRSKNSDPAEWDRAWVVDGSAVQALADRMASTIRSWLDTKQILESEGRPIKPGDILILLAKRAPLAEPILRSLRALNIPVTGIDRMVLSDQIAVQDTLAALSFALAPDDDLNLAALLKGPFVGMDEDMLFHVAHGRKTSLWDSLRNNHAYNAVSDWLSGLLAIAGSATPAAFLHHVFYTSCPANAVSGMRALLGALGADAIDPLQEVLARADNHMMSGGPDLQGFLNDALSDTSEIKRQMDASGNRVRLMTVHGAKGLEAPIVFLPDTIRRKQSLSDVDALQWPDRQTVKTQDNVPLWSINAKNAAPQLLGRLQDALERGEEEYRRLLYVALTRPAERLYIAGAQNDTDGKYDPQSWYFACRDAFDHLELVQNDTTDAKIRFIHNAQTSETKDKRKSADHAHDHAPLPDWALKAAPSPEFPPRPLMPSKPEGVEPATLSPLAGDDSARFKRGSLIHTLFQFLPDLAPDQRHSRAADWLARPAHQLSQAQQSEIMKAVFDVLDHSDFADLFGPRARAEVPITGMLGPAIVSGQIDRLLITDDSITVLDYKTNRPAPRTKDGVSPTYKAQLRLYRDLLKKIYPNKDIRAALLWTDGPALMDMTLDL